MSECRRLQPILSRMAEGEAEPQEALAIARHLPDCTACRILLARERRLAEMLERDLEDAISVSEAFLQEVMARLPEGPPPRTRKRGVLRIAMALGGLGLCGWLASRVLALGGHSPSPVMPSFEGQNPEGLLEVLQSLARTVLAVLNAIGTSLSPELPALLGPIAFAFGLTFALGTTLMMVSAAALLAARHIYKVTTHPH